MYPNLAALAALWPALAPFLAVVPVVQVLAVPLSKITNLWGVKHSTVWSRFWFAVAAWPGTAAPEAPPAPVPAGIVVPPVKLS